MPSLDPVADIKDRLPVEQLLGNYLTLRRAGVNFKALCPFHNEKTPSFMVSPERRTWHCFGCAKGGDIFSFVMEMEGLDFREALELLAKKAGVELPKFEPRDKERASRSARLFAANEAAVKFFEEQLRAATPEAAHARAELARRKLDDLTRDLFHVGFAPAAWDALTVALTKQGFTENELAAAGLAVRRPPPKHGVYDRFRNRLTFPLVDVVGRVVGFSARALDPNETMGKYINSPETEVYRKGRFLFALNHAKGEIRKRGFAILVEGQMDAVSSHRVGVTNVVATSGTALTPEHLSLLHRYTSNLVLAFDVDMAGANATKRGIDLAIASGFNVKVAKLPPGVDPDDLCRERPKEWGRAINESEAIVAYYLRQSSANRDLTQVEHKKAVARAVLPEVARLQDPVEQAHYLQKLGHLLGVDEVVLRRALDRARPRAASTGAPAAPAETPASATAPVDPFKKRLARLVAVGVRSTVTEEDVAPLRAIESPSVASVRAVLERCAAGPATEAATVLSGLDDDMRALVDRELFTLDREREVGDELVGATELRSLVTLVAREVLRRELTDLHRKAAYATGDAAHVLQQQFVAKTAALTALEATVEAQAAS
ncbi:MAG: DNA primase [Candidatus Andersenbacteria bacterium]